MESTQGLDLLDQLLGFWVVFVVVPLAAWLKTKDWVFCQIIRPEFVKLTLGIGGAFGLVAILSSFDLGAEDTIRRGLQAVGFASGLYGGTRLVIKQRERRKKLKY